jgi:predicted transcriptional regulator
MTGTIILKDKQAKVLLALKNVQQPWHITSLAKASESTYVHTHNFIKTCLAMGIVSIDKHGKIKEIKLTEKGVAIADMISGIYTIMNQTKTQQAKPQDEKEEKEKKEEKK